MKKIKISIIGAGSGCFSLGLIKDICLTPKLKNSIISFMDIDEDRLNSAYDICLRYAKELNIELTLEKTMDRRECLEGADFVINTALAASHERLKDGWAIAEKYGFKFGGSYHVMYDEAFWINFYQFNLFESITRDILEICPNAWLLLVANPVISAITLLIRKYPKLKIVGLCHGFNAINDVADILGLDKEHITYEIPGVNHFVFLNNFNYKGESAIPILDKWIETKSEEFWKTNDWKKNTWATALSPKLVDIYKKFGVLPIGDTCSWSGASWPWWYHSDVETEGEWEQNPKGGWDGYFNMVKRTAEDMHHNSEDLSLRLTDIYTLNKSSEPMIPLIESIAYDIPRVIITNIQNTNEFVQGVPKDFEVEIPTLVSKNGVQGIITKPLPKGVIAHILRDRVAPVELELEAYEKGSRELLVQLVLTDKWATSLKQVNDFIDEIFALPYHNEIREYYL